MDLAPKCERYDIGYLASFSVACESLVVSLRKRINIQDRGADRNLHHREGRQ